jgi:hypothetical protein
MGRKKDMIKVKNRAYKIKGINTLGSCIGSLRTAKCNNMPTDTISIGVI